MDLRVAITEEQFANLSGFSLGQALIQPVIYQVRGKSYEVKRQVYDSLTPGQKALFGFWVLYGHTGTGWLQFFHGGMYLGGYEQFLPMIKAGFQHLNDPAMLENVTRAEAIYAQYKERLNTLAEPDSADETAQAFAPVSEQLHALLPETMGRIERYIRARPEEFVVFGE